MNISAFSPNLADHLLVLAFAVAWPLTGYFTYAEALRRLRDGSMTRVAMYRQVISIQWLMAVLTVVLWLLLDRDWAILGLAWGEVAWWRPALGALLVAAMAGLLVRQLRALDPADDKSFEALADAFRPVEPMMPHDARDLRWFNALSFTAGVVEELLWRGFLIAWLAHYLPLWLAVLGSALAFGLGHAYQGLANVPKVFAIGLALAGLYLLSGSLWLAMLAHFLFDVFQGRLAWRFLNFRAPAPLPS